MASANIRSLLAYDLIAAGLGLKSGAISENGHIFSTSSLRFFGLGPLRSQWQVAVDDMSAEMDSWSGKRV
jgi:hypothetical protein